jgi:hypothetical protein
MEIAPAPSSQTEPPAIPEKDPAPSYTEATREGQATNQNPMKPETTGQARPEMVTPLNRLRAEPTWIDCPFCKRRAMTKTNKEGTSMQM